MQRIADDDRFPALADDDPEGDFEFGLERILDGVQVLIDRGASSSAVVELDD